MRRIKNIHNRQLPFLFLFLVIFGVNNSFAQNRSVDSLRLALRSQADDTGRVNTLNRLSDELWKLGKYDSLLLCAQYAEKLAEKSGFKKGLARALMNEAIAYDTHGDYQKALQFGQKALSINKQIGDKQSIASNYNVIGNSYFACNNLVKALEYYSLSLAINRELGNKKGISTDLCNMGNTYASEGNYPKALEYYTQALGTSTEIKDNDGVARILGNMGIIYYSQANYSRALDCYSKALLMNRKSANKSQAADNLANIGNIYVAQNNFTKALEYYRNALAINEDRGDKAAIGNCLGNIGTIYAGLRNSDSALKYDRAALSIARETGDNDGVGVGFFNIGNIYWDNGNYSKALQYYFNALPILKSVGDKRFIISSYTNIGNSYSRQKNYKLAKTYLDSALNLSLRISEKDEMQAIYLSMFNLDSAAGNQNEALEDYKKYVVWRDSAINHESMKKITRMELGFEYQKREDSIRAEQQRTNIIRTAEISRRNIITYSTIVIEILTAILAILFINRQQIRRKRDKLLYEREKQRMEDELNNAKIMLDEYLRSMVEKNELLEQFKADVEELKRLRAKEVDDEARIENIEILNKTTILTEDDWNKFKELFEQVYKGFFIRLKEKFPDLTQAEIRLVCLSKLKLDTKQMAGILGVSTDTIKKTRYRLRKKLGLSGEDNIEEIDISL